MFALKSCNASENGGLAKGAITSLCSMGVCGKELLFVLVIMLGPFTFGTILGYPNPTKTLIFADHPDLVKNSIYFDIFNACTSLFALFGPLLVPPLLKKFGGSRKKVVFVIAVYSTAMWYLTLLTKVNIWAGIVIRALSGIGIGAYSSISPMYIVEMAPEGARGFFGCLNQIAIVIGLVFVNVISPSLQSYMKICYICGAFCVLQAILIWAIPESPAVAREKEAAEKKQQEDDENKKESLWQKKYAKGLIIGIVMMFVQQFCGCNAILTNLSELMNQAGLNIHADYQSVIAQCAQLVAVFVGSAIMDKFGRRVVWIISSVVLIVFLLIFILYDRYNWNNSALPLVCIFFYEFGFGVGMGPIPWFIIPEYFSDAVRPLATTLVSSSNWIFSFIVIVSFPSMQKKMNLWGAMSFYLAVTILGLIFGIVYVTEPTAMNKSVSNEDEQSSSADKPQAL